MDFYSEQRGKLEGDKSKSSKFNEKVRHAY